MRDNFAHENFLLRLKGFFVNYCNYKSEKLVNYIHLNFVTRIILFELRKMRKEQLIYL